MTAVLVENGEAVGVRTAAGEYRGRGVILCCGGASYPGTGSNGDGYKLAAAVGHTIVTAHALFGAFGGAGPLVPPADGPLPAQLRGEGDPAGQEEARLRGFRRAAVHPLWAFQGPTILSASAHLHPMEPGKYTVHVDLKPALSEQQLDARLLRELEAHKK